MEIIKPAYYDSFRCLAGACPDSCCKEWAVQVDEDAAEFYRTLPGELGDDLRRVMQVEDGDTILALTPDRRCPMWRQDGLCRIQAQLGEDALCHTCKQFPRLRHDYGDFVELDLELSCPEAARLILSGDRSMVTAHVPGGEEPDYDPEVMDILRRTKAEILAFLDSGTLPVGQSLAVMLLYGYAVQQELDGGEPATLSADRLLRTAQELARPGKIEPILEFYKSLEILTPAWLQRLNSPSPALWSEGLRRIACYFVNRYWPQAVSDFDLVGRVKLAALSCLVIKTLGGDLAETAQLYSKEIENDADNIDAILDGAYTAPALADVGLLNLLLEDCV